MVSAVTVPSRDDRANSFARYELAEAAYRVLFDGAADAILVADDGGRYVDANEAALALIGYSRDELRQMHVHDLVALGPAWAEKEYERFKAAGSWRDELEVRRKDGTLVTVEAHATRVDLPAGPVFISVMRDLTERRRDQEQQRRRMRRLRQLTDAMPVLIGFVDAQERYSFNNKTYEEWMGRPRAELFRQPLREVLGEDGYAVIRPYVQRALAGERVEFEAPVPYPDGRTRYVAGTYVPHIEPDGTIHGFYLMIDDVTERKRSEDAGRLLADASAALADTLDAETALQRLANVAVPRLADACVVDLLEEDGYLRRAAVASIDLSKAGWVWEVARAPLDRNAPHGPAYVLRTGEPELVPEITDEFLARSARNAEHLEHLKRTRIKSHVIVPLRARGRTMGTVTFVSSRSGRRYGPEDLVLAEDLAQRAALAVDNVRLYQEAQAALRIRDDLLSSVSHDLRTPITSIKGRAQILLRRAQRGIPTSPEAIADALTAIDGIADRMNALVGELVDSGRLQSGRPLELHRRPTDLVGLVREVAAEAQRMTSDHVIRIVTERPDVIGVWDAPRLERVLANLLSNAVRYSPDGGEVIVTVATTGTAEDAAAGGTARVTVQDRGVGIPAADLPHVFERFRRGRNVTGRIAGSGIGLAGAKLIVEQHGGTISIASREGAGTTVTVTLPLDMDEAEPG
jgi:PAS domain S-box-containing protein